MCGSITSMPLPKEVSSKRLLLFAFLRHLGTLKQELLFIFHFLIDMEFTQQRLRIVQYSATFGHQAEKKGRIYRPLVVVYRGYWAWNARISCLAFS